VTFALQPSARRRGLGGAAQQRGEVRLYNETRVHPRTREIIVTDGRAFSRPARAVENWAPAAAGRTVKSAGRAFGGWNVSYTVVEPRLFGEQRRLASQLAWRRDLGVRCQLARLLFTAPQSARCLGPRVALGRSTLRPRRGKDSRQGAVIWRDRFRSEDSGITNGVHPRTPEINPSRARGAAEAGECRRQSGRPPVRNGR